MTMHRGIIRAAAAVLLGALALTALAAPVAQAADPAPCRVRNVTQDTAGTSVRAMVRAAHDGDRLTVRGVCVGPGRIDKDLRIEGRGDRHALVGGDGHYLVVWVMDARVQLVGLTIRGGCAGCGPEGTVGGGIRNGGVLELTRVVVRDNGADDNDGGGIFNYGAMTLLDSVVRENDVDWGYGGGIYNRGSMTLVDSVVAANTGVDVYEGAGIYNGGTLVLVGSFVRHNIGSDMGNGGGIFNEGMLILSDTVVSGNVAESQGGGIYNGGGGTVSLRGTSSVTGNTPDDCYGTPAC